MKEEFMDKRTVLFVISLTLALFGIRIGFDYYNQDKKQEWLAEQAKRAEIEKQARLQEAKARTAKLTDLPFVAIAESSTAFGVVQDGWLLTVSSQPINWPEKITVTKSNAVYVLKEKRSDQLALYVDHPDAWIPLKCANLAHTGKFEIQFISLAKDKTVPQITVADFIDDKLTFVAEAPSGLAVGVVKVGSVYLPLKTRNSSPLSQSLKSILKKKNLASLLLQAQQNSKSTTFLKMTTCSLSFQI
jgi:hypothetical protein